MSQFRGITGCPTCTGWGYVVAQGHPAKGDLLNPMAKRQCPDCAAKLDAERRGADVVTHKPDLQPQRTK